ncbi:MAG: glycosyltransferase family 2 protein [Propionicimonas sp.]|nr:glycosyltransferase family 2 protein [Propionicimonas sp.]
MKLVMTLLVRDEIDIVAAMIEHHLAQGVDLIIATDNGSVDGTRELLAAYAARGRLEVHDYPVHDKKQYALVSAMASRAFTEHGADWVINADADEFFVPVDRSLTLKQAFEQIPVAIGSFVAPVVNITGHPARDGSGLTRLRWRDTRPEETLMTTAGLHAHPTGNAVHVGRAGVQVTQGNHEVDIPSAGEPDPAFAIEVLHYPWRSWVQFSSKVEKTGLAYSGNPKLNPSPRHHGMRDYRFLQIGALEHFYVIRHPSPAILASGEAADLGLVEDTWLASELARLVTEGTAFEVDSLGALLAGDGDPSDYSEPDWQRAGEVMQYLLPLETERGDSLTTMRDERNRARNRARRAKEQLARARAELKAIKASRSYRFSRALGRPARSVRRLLRRG